MLKRFHTPQLELVSKIIDFVDTSHSVVAATYHTEVMFPPQVGLGSFRGSQGILHCLVQASDMVGLIGTSTVLSEGGSIC